jgi:hypothetical protein
MAKAIKNKVMLYNDSYYGDFSLDVLRMSRHATQRAAERKIPVAELLQSRSHINGYVDKVVSKNGVAITAYPRSAPNFELPTNGRRFTFPINGIGLFIGKQHANIKRTQAEYQLKSLYFDEYNHLIAVAPTSDYDWTPVENMIEIARKRKYKPQQQLLVKKNEKK